MTSQVFFITGTSRGLGAALAQIVLDAGHSVVATARNSKTLEHLTSRYGSDRVLALDLDVTDASQAIKVAQEAKAKFGRIDVLVNNAGYADNSSIEDISLESFQNQINANFYGVVYVTKAVLPIMREQQSGRILQVSSVGGRIGSSPGLGAYQAAKFAVAGFSTVLASEVKPFNIKVTILEPGGIRTEWNELAKNDTPVSEPYKQTVEAFCKIRDQMAPGWTPPEQIAKGILKISQVDDPPMRLLLGKDTVPYAKATSEGMRADDEKWLEITQLEG